MPRLRWHISSRGGHDADVTEFDVSETDAEWLYDLRDQVERMLPSRRRSETLVTLRTVLDAFALFPGSRFVG